MTKKQWKKGKWTVICALAGAGCLLTACGAKSSEKTEAGMKAVEEQSYEEALADFEQAVSDGEDLELVYRGQGLAYMGMGDYENAIVSFEEALKQAGMFPSNLEYDINFYLATAKYKSGDAMAAIDTLDAIVDLRENDKDAFFLRGSAWMKVGESEKGKADFEKAIELSRSDPDMVIDIYEVLANYNLSEDGKAYLNKLLSEHPKDLNEFEKGRIYYYLEDYENARNNLENAKSNMKKPDAVTVLMLGRSYEALDESDYASGLYSAYLQENDPDAEMYNQLGLCKLKAEDYAGAMDAFTAGLQVEDNPYRQSLMYNQAVACEYLGDFEKAKGLMKDYTAAYPEDEAAKKEYAFLKSR